MLYLSTISRNIKQYLTSIPGCSRHAAQKMKGRQNKRNSVFLWCCEQPPLISQVAGIKGMFLANRKLDNQVKTYITYNRGRDWRLLQAPRQDLKGNSIHCVLASVSQHAGFTLYARTSIKAQMQMIHVVVWNNVCQRGPRQPL